MQQANKEDNWPERPQVFPPIMTPTNGAKEMQNSQDNVTQVAVGMDGESNITRPTTI